MRQLAQLVSLALLCSPPIRLSAQFADSVTATPVGGSVYMLAGAGDVIAASVGPDGVLLVDNGFPQTEPAVRAAIEGLGGGAPRYVINTHWHHTGANEAFAPTATIIGHVRTRDRLRDGAVMYVQDMPPRDAAALPDVVFADSLSLFFNGERIDLLYLPEAHTDTDIAVVFTESNVAVLGDLYVPFIPVTDYASGGDLYASVRAVEWLLGRLDPASTLIPGHGQAGTYQDLQAFHSMLTAMIAYVERAVARGDSAEEIVATGVPEEWRGWLGELLDPAFVMQNLYDGVVANGR